MRDSVPKVMLAVLVTGLALAAAPLSRVVGDIRYIPVKTAAGEGAATVSKLDGSRTGYYYDLGEHAGQLRPAARRVVLLGLGGGEMLRAARRSLPKAELIGVDNDPAMIRAALDEFHISAFGAKAAQADAFMYVKALRGVDVLMVDLFVGDQMPAAMLEGTFWSDCRQALGPRGIVVVNVYPPAVVPKMRDVWGFREIEADEVHGSTVLFGSL
jgi:spermidine synthase